MANVTFEVREMRCCKLLEAQGFNKESLHMVVRSTAEAATQAEPDEAPDAEDLERFLNEVCTDKYVSECFNEIAQDMAQFYTDVEVDALTAFYLTPVGKRSLEYGHHLMQVMPQIIGTKLKASMDAYRNRKGY